VANAELVRSMVRMELQQQTLGAHVFSPTAAAKMYRSAVETRVIVTAPAVTWFQPSPPPAAVLAALQAPALAPDAPESQVQALMERVAKLYSLESDAGAYPVLLVGRSSAPTFGTRKPDLVAFLAAAPAGGQPGAPRAVSYDALHAVFVGELKRRRSAGADGRFADEEKAAVLSFLEDLVREQLWRFAGGDRARVVAFLCDGAHILFFQCTFASTLSGAGPAVQLLQAHECGPLPLAGEGAALLTGLLKASPQQLGYELPRCQPDGAGGEEVTLRAYLGAGATSLGFAVELRHGGAAVLKQYHSDAAAPAGARALVAELRALRAAAGVPGVCQLLGTARSTVGAACLLLAPLGVVTYSLRASHAAARATAAPPPLAAGLWLAHAHAPTAAAPLRRIGPLLPGAPEFCDLVDALGGMHAAGWVHRDPRPANFYRDGAGRFVLCDLGSAARADARCDDDDDDDDDDGRPWAFQLGPLAALRALRAGATLPPPAPAHDFEQVARCAYVALARDGDTLPSPHCLAAAAELCGWWEARDDTVVLAPLLRAAGAAAAGTATGREQLKAAIRAAFPLL
jgi:hypothetical protein